LLGREIDRAEPSPGSGQRQKAVALDPVRLHDFHEPRPAPQFFHARGHERLLGLPDQPRRVVFRRKDERRPRWGWFGRFQDVQAHGVGRCLVQHQGKVIEGHHLVEPAAQVVQEGR
jgi:hypothetical protein